MKKKIALMATSLVLVAALAVGGTLAYLTATKSVTNIFTVGDIDLTLVEENWEDNSKLIPGTEIPKDPVVTVVKDSEDCYVRILVTINKSDVLDELLPNADLNALFKNYSAVDWDCIGNVEDNTKHTRTYEFRYIGEQANTQGIVEQNSDSDTQLPALFTGVVVPNNITGTQLEELDGFQIVVEAQAIQAAGFTTAADAWAEFPAS